MRNLEFEAPSDRASLRSARSASLAMASGTAVSRISGFVRSALLVAALGSVLRADTFSVANTLPNMIYILVAGGVFNAVLVPQLVRAIRNDGDKGSAYANRVLTLAILLLAGVTILLVVATPWLLRLYLGNAFYEPARAENLRSVIALTRLCLPQVFFYGMFVLVGQILNAHGRFAPMMWAPISNNAVAIVSLVVYLGIWGRASSAEQLAPFTGTQELVLGLGSTLGIVLQFLILLPFLRSTGLKLALRLDFRGVGLNHTLKLGLWTVLFVLVNQVAYLIVVNLAVSNTLGSGVGTGLTVYSNAFLIIMVPHSIVTVSLTTALLPRISAYAVDGRLIDMGLAIGATLRTALALVLPFVTIVPIVSSDITDAIFGWGEGNTSAGYGLTLALFAPALAFFSVHYVMLRGFYALEQTREAFLIQCLVSLVNIVAAFGFVHLSSPRHTAAALAAAYLCAYIVGSVVSYLLLRATLGGLDTPTLTAFLAKMAIALSAAALTTWLIRWGLVQLLDGRPGNPLQSFLVGTMAGGAGLAAVLASARLLRVREALDATTLSR